MDIKHILKSWLIFALIIILAFAGLYAYQSKKKAPEKTLPLVEKPEEKESEKPKKPSLPSGKPVERLDEEVERNEKELLSKLIFLGTGCEQLKTEAMRNECNDIINFNNGTNNLNASACQKIIDQNLKIQCLDEVYNDLAIKNRDSLYCEKITEADIKQKCSDLLIASAVENVKSEKDCDLITDPKLQQACLDNFYFSKSVKDLKENGCEKISDPSKQTRCIETVQKNRAVIAAAKETVTYEYQSVEKQLETCDKLSGQDALNCKESSYYELAAEKLDLSYCNLIKTEGLRKQCLDEQTTNIDSYYLKQAVIKKDSSFCNKIQIDRTKAVCLAETTK